MKRKIDKIQLARQIATRSEPRFVDIPRESRRQRSYNKDEMRDLVQGNWANLERERLAKTWDQKGE